jgi:hypothetical protein
MIMAHLQGVANAVLRRAQKQGFVVPREVRAELAGLGLSGDLWKEVISLVHPPLDYQRGRYYYSTSGEGRLEEEKRQQREVLQVIRQLIRQQRALVKTERRNQERIDFVQQIKLFTEDDRELNVLSRDISTKGLRFIASRGLLGQRVRVVISRPDNSAPICFVVRILWTCIVGDGLFENGGNVLSVLQ